MLNFESEISLMFPKKSFSQNFLHDEKVVSNIVQLGQANTFDWIVEIGAGEGVLTEALAQEGAHIVALEFDRDLIPGLLRRFPLASPVSLVEADILRANIPEILQQKGYEVGDSWAVFGNIPYAITGKILRILVSLADIPDSIVLMMQKEVAERIVAHNHRQSLLSLSVALFGEAEILFAVQKEAFFPAPQVESAVIRITPNKHCLPLEEREHILRLAKIGFASKRKTLLNNFSAHHAYSRELLIHFLESIGKTPSARAEELSAEEWKQFAQHF